MWLRKSQAISDFWCEFHQQFLDLQLIHLLLECIDILKKFKCKFLPSQNDARKPDWSIQAALQPETLSPCEWPKQKWQDTIFLGKNLSIPKIFLQFFPLQGKIEEAEKRRFPSFKNGKRQRNVQENGCHTYVICNRTSPRSLPRSEQKCASIQTFCLQQTITKRISFMGKNAHTLNRLRNFNNPRFTVRTKLCEMKITGKTMQKIMHQTTAIHNLISAAQIFCNLHVLFHFLHFLDLWTHFFALQIFKAPCVLLHHDVAHSPP